MSRTATRALDLFDCVVTAPHPLGLMEIAEATGLDKSTTQRLLTLLVDRRMLSRDPLTKQYSLGTHAYGLAAAINTRSDLVALAAPHFVRLRDESGESVSLHVPDGTHRVCVDGLESRQEIRQVVSLGESLPIHQGPSGKAILAFLPQPEADAIVTAAKPTAVERQRIAEGVASLRRNGYLHTEGDRSPGVRALSAPIFDARGVCASLSIAGPADRWSEERALMSVDALISVTGEISRGLGGSRPSLARDEPNPAHR
ncbi:MAG TPA: IclR family transcriptional regulator [Gryllotalpicola sp.]